MLRVRDLQTYFRAGNTVARAVDGVSFEVPAGASVGIVGESGSGKSVTALSIMRLVDPPGWIQGGSVVFRGTDLLQVAEPEVQRLRGGEIAMVFQEPMTALNPVYSVGEQVSETLRLHQGLGRQAALRRAIELFELVGIPDPQRRVAEYPHHLSGGMRQRVMIAMAVANDPDLLILDEPTTALDVTIQAQILDVIRRLRREARTAILLITHDIGVIAEMSDEVIVMYGGKVMERGTALQVLKDPKHPYTRALLTAVPSTEMRKQRLTVIGGTVPDPARLPPGCPFAPRCPSVMDVCRCLPDLATLADGRQVLCWLYIDTHDGGAA